MEEFDQTPTNSDEILDTGQKATIAPLHEESQIISQQDSDDNAPGHAYEPATSNLRDDMESTGASEELTNATQAADKRAAEILAMHKAVQPDYKKVKVVAIVVASLLVVAALAYIFLVR